MSASISSNHTRQGATDRPGWKRKNDPVRREAMCAAFARNWWATALRGIFGIIFGLISLFLPGVTMLSLVLIFAAYAIADGIFAIVSAVRAIRKNERWGLLAFQGALSIFAGVVAALWPAITVLAFVILVAAWALVSGLLMTAAGLQLNKDDGGWWLLLGGIASFFLGTALLLAPLVGAVVLTWWIGAYALVFGIALLVLAFKLRSRNRASPPAPEPQTA